MAGFHHCDDKGDLLDVGIESDYYRCDGCGSFVHIDEAETQEEPDRGEIP